GSWSPIRNETLGQNGSRTCTVGTDHTDLAVTFPAPIGGDPLERDEGSVFRPDRRPADRRSTLPIRVRHKSMGVAREKRASHEVTAIHVGERAPVWREARARRNA